jgi:hypothetical protein
MYIAECTVTVRFDKDDVVDWLVDNEEITEEYAETYTPTLEELQAYAWELIEQDDGEYGTITMI